MELGSYDPRHWQLKQRIEQLDGAESSAPEPTDNPNGDQDGSGR